LIRDNFHFKVKPKHILQLLIVKTQSFRAVDLDYLDLLAA